MHMHIQIRISHDGKIFEGEAALTEVVHRGGTAKKSAQPVKHARPPKPAGAVDGLYGKGYFAGERTLADVRGQLQQDGYNFGAPSVLMALRSKGYLQRRGNRGSYRFVQKYPPTSA
jgi:hypothetical protein